MRRVVSCRIGFIHNRAILSIRISGRTTPAWDITDSAGESAEGHVDAIGCRGDRVARALAARSKSQRECTPSRCSSRERRTSEERRASGRRIAHPCCSIHRSAVRCRASPLHRNQNSTRSRMDRTSFCDESPRIGCLQFEFHASLTRSIPIKPLEPTVATLAGGRGRIISGVPLAASRVQAMTTSRMISDRSSS